MLWGCYWSNFAFFHRGLASGGRTLAQLYGGCYEQSEEILDLQLCVLDDKMHRQQGLVESRLKGMVPSFCQRVTAEIVFHQFVQSLDYRTLRHNFAKANRILREIWINPWELLKGDLDCPGAFFYRSNSPLDLIKHTNYRRLPLTNLP